MPEHVRGQFSVPSCGDSEQWFRDTLGRLEAQQEMLGRAVAELATQVEQVAEAEAILRRAASPDRPRRPSPPRRGHRGDTILYVVRVALVTLLGVGTVLALMAPRHLRDQRYSPRCTVACARPVAQHNDHDADDAG